MEADVKDWFYLVTITGNFEGLYQYYFSAIGNFAPIFRQAAVGILYSVGLAWAALCFLKAPVDRLLAGLGVMMMIVIAGFLLSPTTNNKHLSNADNEIELSLGAYYAFALSGTLTRIFDNAIYSSFTSTIRNATGGQGTVSDAIAIAYSNAAEKSGERFGGMEGSEAVVDYQVKCGAMALKHFTTEEDRDRLRTIGIGSNSLGTGDWERGRTAQYIKDVWEIGPLDALIKHGYIDATKAMTVGLFDFWTKSPDVGLELLAELPDESNLIDGTKGYRIPTVSSYKANLSDDPEAARKDQRLFETISSDSKNSRFLSIGATTVKPGTAEDAIFYPKNCLDLYEVASKTMENFKGAVKGLPEYEGLENAQLFATIAASNAARLSLVDQMNAMLQSIGSDHRVDISIMEGLSDHIWTATSSISNFIDKWMLEFKIPGVIASMALLVVVLVVTFPIFALLSVLLGPGILWTYLKLMALPFLVVFINRFLLTSATHLVMFNKQYEAVTNMSSPGKPNAAASFAAMNSETILYLLICGCEIGIVFLLLWNDARGVTRFNIGNATAAAAMRGGKLVMAGGALIRGQQRNVASAQSKIAQNSAAIKQANTLGNIRQSVTKISDQFVSSKAFSANNNNTNLNTSLTPSKPPIYTGQGTNHPVSSSTTGTTSLKPSSSGSRNSADKNSQSGNSKNNQ